MRGERVPPLFFLTLSSIAGGLAIVALGYVVRPWGDLAPSRAATLVLSTPWLCALATAYINRGPRGVVYALRGFNSSAAGPLWLDVACLVAAAALAWLDGDHWWAVLPWIALTWEGVWRGFVFERLADNRPA